MRNFVLILFIGLFALISCEKNEFTKEEVFIKIYGNSLNQEAKKIISIDANRYVILASTEFEIQSDEDENEAVKYNKGVVFFVDNNGNQLGSEMSFPNEDINFYPSDIVQSGNNFYVSGSYLDENLKESMALVELDLNGVPTSSFGLQKYPVNNAITNANGVMVSSSNEIIITGYIDTNRYVSLPTTDPDTRIPYAVKINSAGEKIDSSAVQPSGQVIYGEYTTVKGNETDAIIGIGSEYVIDEGTSERSNNSILIENIDPVDMNKRDAYLESDEFVNELIGKDAYMYSATSMYFIAHEKTENNSVAILDLDVSSGFFNKNSPIKYYALSENVVPEGVTSDDNGNILFVGTYENELDNEDRFQIYSQFINSDGTTNTPEIFGGQGDETPVDVINANDEGFLILATTEYGENKMINLIKLSKDGRIK